MFVASDVHITITSERARELVTQRSTGIRRYGGVGDVGS
jgi:hypothetical protein